MMRHQPMRIGFLLPALILMALPLFADKRPMTIEDLWLMKRIGDVQLSPDGAWLVYELTCYDMEKNFGATNLWLVSTAGGEPRQLTGHTMSNSRPRWKPDGSAIAFLSSRNGSQQIYLLPLAGGEAVQLTDFPLEVEDFIWSPGGDRLAFSALVHPQAENMQESSALDKERDASAVKAYIADHLLFRSWNRWTEGKRTHVFVCDAEGDNAVDLTPGDFDAPPLDLGGAQDYVFSPDGRELAFVSNRTAMAAANTNNDIFFIPIVGGTTTNFTAANEAVDNQPLYSPNGKFLTYRAMKRPGYEADEYEIILYDREKKSAVSLTKDFDRTPDQVVWSPDSKALYFTAEDYGRESIFQISIKTEKVEKLVREHVNKNLIVSADGGTLYFKRQSNVMPDELFSLDLRNKSIRQLTFVNKPLLDELEMNPVEEITFTSFDGQPVHGFLLKPPFFDPAKKYPLVYLIHGGPQGMWSDDFHYRWNTSMFAARGFVVAALNIRGSKGYGQGWCDAVSGDWGGGPYKDVMAGLDYLLQTFDFIDADKIAAAGASYGGYMINWIATQTDRFDVLVSHAGVYDVRSKYGATDELWFPEWEFGGTPYEHPELYEKWSPSSYAENLKKFKTPTLVIHGERDYRVPVTQAFQMFTALQRMGVPSRLVCFPDETHFVSKPQNARLWWNEVFSWMEKWINDSQQKNY